MAKTVPSFGAWIARLWLFFRSEDWVYRRRRTAKCKTKVKRWQNAETDGLSRLACLAPAGLFG
jgi:hypothetical protein